MAAVSLGAVPFSIYQTSSPEQIEYVVLGRRRQAGDHRVGVPRHLQQGSREAAGNRDPGRHRRRRRRADARLARGARPRLRPRRVDRRGPARRPADPDLHLRHHRATEGRAAHPSQPDEPGRRGRRDDRAPRARGKGDLVAAGRAHRRARRQLLPARGPGALGHGLPRPPPDRRVHAAGAADLVLRRAADLGEAQGRARGEARRGPRRGGRARSAPRSRPRCRRSASSRRARRSRSRSRPRSRRPTRRCSRTCGWRSGSTRRSRSASARRRPRSRCSSSSTRSGSRSASSGGCRRRAGWRPSTRPSG